jgi:hypothetical protein
MTGEPITTALLVSAVAGSGLAAYGFLSQGQAANAAAKAEAAQMQRKGIETKAIGQRTAAEERRKAGLIESEARAEAAASGGDTTDKGVGDLLAGLSAEGEYNALTRMFEAESSQNDMMYGAAIRRNQGKSAYRAGVIGAVSEGLKAPSTFVSQYNSSMEMQERKLERAGRKSYG